MSTSDIEHQLTALIGQPNPYPTSAATVLMCLPPPSADDGPKALYSEIGYRMIALLGTTSAVLCPGHLHPQANLDLCEQGLIIAPQPGAGPLPGCAGGPLGLLDFTDSADLVATVATDEYDTWAKVVAGTPDAIPFSDLVGAFAHDPAVAASAFCAQPRIAAMLAADERGEARRASSSTTTGRCWPRTRPVRPDTAASSPTFFSSATRCSTSPAP